MGLIAVSDAAIQGHSCGRVGSFLVHHAREIGVLSRAAFQILKAENLVVADCTLGLELGLNNGAAPNS